MANGAYAYPPPPTTNGMYPAGPPPGYNYPNAPPTGTLSRNFTSKGDALCHQV